jgi:hypothetical protein
MASKCVKRPSKHHSSAWAFHSGFTIRFVLEFVVAALHAASLCHDFISAPDFKVTHRFHWREQIQAVYYVPACFRSSGNCGTVAQWSIRVVFTIGSEIDVIRLHKSSSRQALTPTAAINFDAE